MSDDTRASMSNLLTFKNMVKLGWSDGKYVPEEKEVLEPLRKQMGISEEEHRALEGLVFLEMAKAAQAKGDDEAATGWFDKIAEQDTPYEQAWKARGLFLAGKDRYNDSRKALEKAEELRTRGAIIDLEPTVGVPGAGSPGPAADDVKDEPTVEAEVTADGAPDANEGDDAGGEIEEMVVDEPHDEEAKPSGDDDGDDREDWEKEEDGDTEGGEVEFREVADEDSGTETPEDVDEDKADGVTDDGEGAPAVDDGEESEVAVDDREESEVAADDEGETEAAVVDGEEAEAEPTETETMEEDEAEDAGDTDEDDDDEDDGGDTGDMACPKCGGPVPVETSERPLIIECPDCGSKGRLTTPGIPNPYVRKDDDDDDAGDDDDDDDNDDDDDDAPYGRKDCPKCGGSIVLSSDERPLVIICPSCGAKGRLTT